MKKRILIVIVGILCAVGMHGQSSGVPSLPQLATPSPKATMIDRFGYYPTNLYTGLVDITIPIHTIEVKGIKIPIEFKYHASGLKYDDLPMEVGYGWTLMAGGTVSYSARGASAYQTTGERWDPYVKSISDITRDSYMQCSEDQKHLGYVQNGQKNQFNIQGIYCDSEYDVSNFSFLGYSGQYYILSADSSFSMPQSSIYFFGSPYMPVARDDSGNEYQFGEKDFDEGYQRNYTHYLTKIISADKADTISFNYRQVYWGNREQLVKRPMIDSRYTITENSTGNVTFVTEGAPGVSCKYYNTPILQEINYKGGRVKFIYSSTNIRSLEEIQICNPYGGILRRISLEKAGHAYLNAVNFKDGDNHNVYSYKMEYNGTKPEGSAGVDYWGYYNGRVATQNFVPNFQVGTISDRNYRIPGMDRTPDEAVMQRGMLKKMSYPTGGYATFVFEGHRNEVGTLYGGLRIKEIANYDAKGLLLERKNYKYGWGESGNGRAVRLIKSEDYCNSSRMLESYFPEYSEGENLYLGDQLNVRSYEAFPLSSYFIHGSTVVYPCVTEYIGTSDSVERIIDYSFTDFVDEWYGCTMRGLRLEFPDRSNSWKCGKLQSKIVRDRAGRTVYELSNIYEEVNRKDYLNLRVLPYISFYGEGGLTQENLCYYSDFVNATDGSLYDYYNYYITSGEYKIKESTEYRDGVYLTTRYKYNALGQVSEQTDVESDGSEQTVRYKYATDLWKNAAGGSIYYAMYSANMLAQVLEKSVYKGSVQVGKIMNEYKDWGDFIALQNVKQLNYYEPRIKYQSYDKYGNPTRISKDGEFEDVSYIWGHKGQRVVAEIRGGSFSALGQTLIDRVTSAVSPSSADMAAIEALRNNHSLEGSRITTYYYDSALNLEQLVMPNGTKTNYEYDSFGRLSCVKDHNGKVVESYQYNYKQ